MSEVWQHEHLKSAKHGKESIALKMLPRCKRAADGGRKVRPASEWDD